MLEAAPNDGELYAELRSSLEPAADHNQLATIAEVHAPHAPEGAAQAVVWCHAASARLALGETAAAHKHFVRSLIQDASNEVAARELAGLLIAAGSYAAAAKVVEDELQTLEGDEEQCERTVSRRASRHRQLARLWDDELGRVDRALLHWQKAWQLEPTRSDALEAARDIYASLGDHEMVLQLYRTELEALGDTAPAPRRAHVELEIGRIEAKRGNLEQAAAHLESSLALAPDSLTAREALAQVYASPELGNEPSHLKRAGELFLSLGTHRLDSHGDAVAIGYLRRSLGADPQSTEGVAALEQALIDHQSWDELDRFYLQQLAVIDAAEQHVDIQWKRVALLADHVADDEALKVALHDLVEFTPPRGEASQRLRVHLREQQEWGELAALIESELVHLEGNPDQQDALCDELLHLATVVRENLGDRDRAAELLHRVLSIDPSNEEGLARYGDHFRERRDWRGLADLIDFRVDNSLRVGADPPQIVRQLEEVARIAELRLGDVDRAIASWRRVQELEPDNNKAAEALRRLMSRARMWTSLVGELRAEADQAGDAGARVDALRRIARVYRERQISPRDAIAVHEEILNLQPGDQDMLRALVDLYEREGDYAGLAYTLRRQLNQEIQVAAGEEQSQGRRPSTAKDLPVAKRVERLTSLRRLASIYEDRLGDEEGVVFACSGVLEILPGDRDALDRMERVLEGAGEVTRLEQTLEYHAESATGLAERTKVLRRLAQLAAGQGDEFATMTRWEKLLAEAPNDRDALRALTELYERHQRFPELARVLEKQILATSIPEQGSTAAAAYVAELVRYARVVGNKLDDRDGAIRAWRRVLEFLPRDREALAALAVAYEAAERWRDLVEILGRQVDILAADDATVGAQLALKRAKLLEERVSAPTEAIQALEAVIERIDPSNLNAHRALRRLYDAHGDFDAAVRVSERELYLTNDRAQKIARGLEIGFLCRDRLGDAPRALQAFARVLELDPVHEEALAAAAELHAKLGDWNSYIRQLELRLSSASEAKARRELMMRIGQVTAERLEKPREAFGWYRKAHDEDPDVHTLQELRSVAEAYGLWHELAEVYESERQAFARGRGSSDTRRYVAVSRALAALVERRLDDRERAVRVLKDALENVPDEDVLLEEVERIAQGTDEETVWQLAASCFDAVIRAAGRTRRVALHMRKAQILEDQLRDQESASAELLHAFAWDADAPASRAALYEFAERNDRWTDVVAVESAMAERADDASERVAVLRRKAQIVEEHLNDQVRAFRIHLRAFLLEPQDSDTIAQLWRLARLIGTYDDGHRRPALEAPPAYIAPESGQSSGRWSQAPVVESSSGPREPTEELSLSDLLPGVRESRRRGEGTMPIDISDLEPAEEEDFPDSELLPPPGSEEVPSEDSVGPALELRPKDLAAAIGTQASPPALPPRPRGRRSSTPPPPPPPSRRSTHPKRSTKRAPLRRRRPAARLTLPDRAYGSPWEEFAAAYSVLPAKKEETKLLWLYRAAEIWEVGAGDLDRAFAALSRALRQATNQTEPRARLRRLADDHQDWDRLAALYEDAAEEADTADMAVDLLTEVADIRSTQGNTAACEVLFRRILGMRPDDSHVRRQLENLYRGQQRWVDLVALLEEHTDPRLGAAAPEAERPALLRELADIYDSRLSRPHDAIDALERLRLLVPADVSVLQGLGDLYCKIARWSKVIEVLGRIGQVAEGTPEAREALRRIAEIYRTELELPDRATTSYQQLIKHWPDDREAYLALDQLHESHGDWQALSDILRRRAAQAEAVSERVELLHRRARVLLDWLSAPEEAVATLRHAQSLAADNGALMEDLVRALLAAHHDREAAALLEEQCDALRHRDAASGDIAAVLIRLAAVRSESLGDTEGARDALEQVLTLVPEHPTALANLARVAEASQDPEAYVAAKLREADVVRDQDAKIDSLMAAGAVLSSTIGDISRARAVFEQVLALRPYHSDATWALAGLVEQGGDLQSASALLENRLGHEVLTAQEQTMILTQLAALARQAGANDVAERRLTEALDTSPDHLPAIMALTDLLRTTERLEELCEYLTAELSVLTTAPKPAQAELHRRLALASEQLGKPDAAYQTLLAADRLDRGNLLVKLALGENRYRARRWREAALHLSAVSNHPEAEHHPAEMADGLYHAALAEIRSLRPEKAHALYERALELKPNHGPSLQALAELAMEANENERAVELLTLHANIAANPAQRVRRFEALGDMVQRTLASRERAVEFYRQAVGGADPLEAQHLPLLRKLLDLQHTLGDYLGCARTTELLAAFGSDAAERATQFKQAAASYIAAGEPDLARAAAERAVAADPYDVTGLTVLSELMLNDEDYEEAAAILGRALSRESNVDDETVARRALLWFRLAQAREARGDSNGAIQAYQRSVESAPDSEGAMKSRAELVELWSDSAEHREDVREFQRLVATSTKDVRDVVGYGYALRSANRALEACFVLRAASVLGHELTKSEQLFLAATPSRALAADEGYRGVLAEGLRVQLIDEPDDEPLSSILRGLWEAAPILWSHASEALERVGVTDAERVGASSTLMAASMFPRIAEALHTPASVLWTSGEGGAEDARAVTVSPPIIAIGPRVQGKHEDVPSAPGLRFLLGRACEQARPERILAAGMPAEDFKRLVSSVTRLFGREELQMAVADEVERHRDEALHANLSVRLRLQLQELFDSVTRPSQLNVREYLDSTRRAADRAGLLMCGSPEAAAGELGETFPDHLVELLLHDRFFEALAILGLLEPRT